MKVISALAGGFAGACVLTILHETVRKFDKDAPHMHLVGMELLSKGIQNTDKTMPSKNNLYRLSMMAEIMSNTIYYSLAAAGGRRFILPKGSLLGLAGGLGAVFLPKYLGVNPAHSERTLKTRILTTSFYLIAGLASSFTAKYLDKMKKTK